MLSNLKELKNDMERKKWCIDGFIFKYKDKDYIVLVKLYVGKIKRPSPNAICRLEFIKRDDVNEIIEADAYSNSIFFKGGGKAFRNFFGIEYRENYGDIFKQFIAILNPYIPTEKTKEDIPEIIKENLKSLSRSDSEDPNKIYCTNVKRNGFNYEKNKYNERSPFNDNKARILRPKLYERFKNCTNVSFCFSRDKEDEKDDKEIYENFIRNEKNFINSFSNILKY